MTDDLEARLRAAVHAEAAAAAADHDAGSLTAIRARTRSARRRRHTLAVLGAGALVVVVGALPRWARDDDQGVSTGAPPDTETTTTTPRTAPSTTTPAPSITTEPSAATEPGTTPTTATPTPSSPPSSPPSTAPARLEGDAGPGCVNGWTTPAPGTALRVEPLDAIRRSMGVTGQFRVIEMRYFTGPEVPEIEAPRPPMIEWWYVKAQLVDDPTFQARWLVVRRAAGVDTEAIAAVAPFDTTGYRSPDWRGFVGDGAPRPIEGLPGQWPGAPYDFVAGTETEPPGLPQENTHCLDAT